MKKTPPFVERRSFVSQLRLAGRCYGLLALFGMALAPLSGFAQDDSLPPLQYDALRSRLDELEAEVTRLKAAPRRDAAPVDDPNNRVTPASAEYLPPAPGYFGAEAGMLAMQPPAGAAPAKPKYPTVTVNGFFQADSLWFNQDAANRASLATAMPPFDGDIQDGAGFRRTRLSAKGAVADNVNYFVQLDFGAIGRPTFTDVWGDVTHLPILGNVRIGQWKQPFGLEAVTSVRYQTFLERSVLFQAFEPFRHIGAGFYDWSEDESTTWQFTVFRTRNDQFGDDIGDNGGWSSVGRITHLPWYEPHGDGLDYLHLGAAFWYGDPSNDRMRYSTIPEAFVGEFGVPAGTIPGTSKSQVPSISNGTPPFVDTGTFFVHDFIHFGLEGLWVRGPFSIQSEWQLAMVNQMSGPLLNYWGMYSQASYFLTGESRPYDRKMGALDRVVPLRPFIHEGDCLTGPGAWELAMRWSTIDLDSGNRNGGRLHDLTAGANWYLNGYAKLQFNYIRAMLDNPTFGNSHADIVGLRCQVDF